MEALCNTSLHYDLRSLTLLNVYVSLGAAALQSVSLPDICFHRPSPSTVSSHSTHLNFDTETETAITRTSTPPETHKNFAPPPCRPCTFAEPPSKLGPK
jgi:hypothetical protein